MKTVIPFVLVLMFFVVSFQPVTAANLNQIQQQVLETAQERQPILTATDSSTPNNQQPETAVKEITQNDQSGIEVLWQAFDGKIMLWRFEGQLYLSFNFF